MTVHTRWYSHRLGRDVQVVRYGHYGAPVLHFPTAGHDAYEAERHGLVHALGPLLGAGRVKLYSCDSVAGQVWTDGHSSGAHRGWMQNQFDAFVAHELVPAVRADCHSPDIELIATGASFGAFNAVASLCRHPDLFRVAIAMSGTYDLSPWLHGEHSFDFHVSSPLHFLPDLHDHDHLARLRRRFVVLALGQGRWEDPGESWRMADVLGSRGVPNRVDMWGYQYDHDWPTWREMLPLYLDTYT
ncbi:esterase family protein [Haliangium sp.]|uniref:esterase family protein n=1 Tax=Haliangium sp. TaxID=2663208 RepID=UPI003D146549